MDPVTGLPRSRRSTTDSHREGLTTETHDWTLVKAIELVEDQKIIIMYVSLNCFVFINYN